MPRAFASRTTPTETSKGSSAVGGDPFTREHANPFPRERVAVVFGTLFRRWTGRSTT